MLPQQGAFEMGSSGTRLQHSLVKASWLITPSGIENGTESRIQGGHWLAKSEKESKNFKLRTQVCAEIWKSSAELSSHCRVLQGCSLLPGFLKHSPERLFLSKQHRRSQQKLFSPDFAELRT